MTQKLISPSTFILIKVISLCGSGENPDCGGNASAKSTCCDGNVSLSFDSCEK